MIAVQHLDVGQQMMREQHRLSSLGVGVAGHNRLDLFSGPADQGGLQRCYRSEEVGTGRLDVEAEVEGDLVIPASAGVEFAAQGPEFFDQALLDKHVNVFGDRNPHPALPQRGRGRERVIRKVGFYGSQGSVDLRLLIAREDTDANQGLCVGPAAGDVLVEKPAIDRQRPREAIDERVRLFLEAPAPGLLAQWLTFAIRLASTSQDNPAICAAGPQSCWLKLRLCKPRISGKNND